MADRFRTTRWLVTACLTVSLTLTGLAPPLTVYAGAEPQSIIEATERCCCGTAGRRCCGMGCCVVRSPKAPEQPAPLPARDDCRTGLASSAAASAGT